MIDTKKYKKILGEELSVLEKQMNEIAVRNPQNPNEWEASRTEETEMGSDSADTNEVADELESYEENVAILEKLQTQYRETKDALERMENGKYGICEVGGEEIDEKRLEANPSARTCIKHAK